MKAPFRQYNNALVGIATKNPKVKERGTNLCPTNALSEQHIFGSFQTLDSCRRTTVVLHWKISRTVRQNKTGVDRERGIVVPSPKK
jgi:hypothetical protein